MKKETEIAQYAFKIHFENLCAKQLLNRVKFQKEIIASPPPHIVVVCGCKSSDPGLQRLCGPCILPHLL